MAVSNLNKFNKYAQQYNIGEYQLIMGADKKGRNVKGMLVSGYMFDRLSQFGLSGDDDIQELMQNISCYGAAKAYEMHVNGRNSVAKQKVNEAHGRSNDERTGYLIQQLMTYGKRFKNIQFVGQTMEGVFDQIVENETITVAQWVEGMKDWHGSNAKRLVFEALQNHTMHVIDNITVCDVTFRDAISRYAKENKCNEPTEEQKTKMINVYIAGLGI